MVSSTLLPGLSCQLVPDTKSAVSVDALISVLIFLERLLRHGRASLDGGARGREGRSHASSSPLRPVLVTVSSRTLYDSPPLYATHLTW